MSAPAGKTGRQGNAGLYVVFGGVACEAVGFALLSQGSMSAAPLLIVGSFAVMGIGIWMGWD